ncbi:MAG: hypothetical protein K2K48_00165 [Anaeroplasmataceae bacterium]|nr:hypothetical protein [Anaeroplasmataceae bacterium]MDE6413811.1 hypothetical protein [Anaeroplasmataceae bacterium]
MSVIADLNIICLDERNKTIIDEDTFSVVCRRNPTKSFYGASWDTLSMLKGNWYQITPIKRDYGMYNDEFFDLYFVNKKASRAHGNYYVVVNCDINIIYNALKKLIDASPIKKICVLFRLDYQKKQKISGVLKFNNFFSKLKNNKILFDMAYIVEL